MTVGQALILGIVQGVTEFLPISSSGHLVLLQSIWHISSNGLLFVTLLHLGTLLAVLFAFRKDIRWLIRHPASWVSKMILLALVPTALIGGLFEEFFEGLFQTPVTVGFEFVITGAILWWMDGVQTGDKSLEDMNAGDALWIGTLQGIAIFPALSRSGLTIAGGLWRGLDRKAAGRFSFLLSVPAILGASLVELEKVIDHPSAMMDVHWGPMVVGVIAAVIAGYLAVYITLWLIRVSKMRIFAVYTWALALFIFADQLFFHHWFPPLF